MLKQIFLPYLAGALGPWCIESLCSSLTWEIRGREHFDSVKDRAHVLVFWHARGLFMGYFFRHRGYQIVTSENTDGEIAARAIAPMGIGALYGSTSRGASRVLLSAARLLKAGRPVAFTPDGPRGPRHVFQPGALAAARMGHAPILPVTASVDRAFVFRSWDRFVLPRQESRAVLKFLPVEPPPDRQNLEDRRAVLQQDLASATDLLDKELGLNVEP